MTNNIDRAADVIDAWTKEGQELNESVGSPHDIASRLADAGLLAPELSEPTESGLMRTPFSQVIRTVQEVTLDRHEYLLTQANCHKRNCGCSATGNGSPEDALKLIQEAIIRDLTHLRMTGETPLQTEVENAIAEKILFDKWKGVGRADA